MQNRNNDTLFNIIVKYKHSSHTHGYTFVHTDQYQYIIEYVYILSTWYLQVTAQPEPVGRQIASATADMN